MVIVMNVVVSVTSAEMERYRAIVADIDGMSDSQKEEAIMIVINIKWPKVPKKPTAINHGQWFVSASVRQLQKRVGVMAKAPTSPV